MGLGEPEEILEVFPFLVVVRVNVLLGRAEFLSVSFLSLGGEDGGLALLSACFWSSVDVADQHRGFFPKAVSSDA